MEETKETKKLPDETKVEVKDTNNNQETNFKDILEEYEDLIKRVQADFENYKKRVERDKLEFVKLANQNLIRQLLKVLDDFKVAMKNKDKKDDFIASVTMTFEELNKILADAGLKEIECVGKDFDPLKHEAVMIVNGVDNKVVEEYQKGYLLNDCLIRASKVKVSKSTEVKTK